MRSIGIVVICHQPGLTCFQQIIQLGKEAQSKQPRIFLESSPVEAYVQAFSQLEKGKPEEIVELTVRSIESLRRAGADIVAIPNNAIHCVFSQLVEQSSVDLVSMVDAVAQACETSQYRSICILGTTPLLKEKIYTTPLEQLGIQVLAPKDDMQEEIHQMAMQATMGNKVSEKDAQKIHLAMSSIRDQSQFDALLIACSELMLPSLKREFAVIDPFQQLAKKVFEVSLS